MQVKRRVLQILSKSEGDDWGVNSIQLQSPESCLGSTILGW